MRLRLKSGARRLTPLEYPQGRRTRCQHEHREISRQSVAVGGRVAARRQQGGSGRTLACRADMAQWPRLAAGRHEAAETGHSAARCARVAIVLAAILACQGMLSVVAAARPFAPRAQGALT